LGNTTLDKKARTKLAILDAAQEAFLEQGYHKTDMRDIAKIADIDKRTIYRYFDSKEALAFIIWQKVLAFVMDFGANATGDSGYEKLESLLYHYMEGVRENQNIIRFLGEFDNVFSGEYPNIEEAEEFVSYITSKGNGKLEEHIKEGVEDKSISGDIDIDLLASTISNILLAISQRIVIRGEHLQIEQGYSYEMLDDTVAILLRGIKA